MSRKLLPLLIILIISAFTSPEKAKKYDQLLTIKTEFGDMKAILFDETPIHKQTFLKNIEQGIYDSNNFHRIINGFMIQGGIAPNGKLPADFDKFSFEKRTIQNEINSKFTHIKGAISAARVENPDKRSDIYQFFIVQNHAGSHFLDGNYTVYGQVLFGLDIVDKIAALDPNSPDYNSKIKFSIKSEKVERKQLVKYYGDIYKKYGLN